MNLKFVKKLPHCHVISIESTAHACQHLFWFETFCIKFFIGNGLRFPTSQLKKMNAKKREYICFALKLEQK